MIQNVVLVQPYKFMCSGVTVGTTPVNVSPTGIGTFSDGVACNFVQIENLGAADVYIHHKSTDVPIEGFEITAPSATNMNIITLPYNRAQTIWAATATGTASIRILVY